MLRPYCYLSQLPLMKPKRRPVAIDLFAGVGGFSLGIEQAGFDIIVAVEKDPIHAAVYAYNFPQTQVLCTDITTLTGKQILNSVGEIDLVFGGPPCQGFSIMGKRNPDDARNHLVFHFCRLIAELQPRYFVMENVPGLIQKHNKAIFTQLIEQLQNIGYKTLAPQILNAADFGVPQERKRLFLLGAHPQENFASLELEFAPRNSTTIQDAIYDLPNLDEFEELKYDDAVELQPRQISLLENTASIYVKQLRDKVPEPDNFAYLRHWNPSLLTSSRRTNHNATSIARFKETEPGKLSPVSRLRRLDWRGRCHTLRAGTGSEKGRFTSARPIHPQYPRVISVREAARLHSFPDWFRFHTTKWHGFRQVGNAVPPLLGRALGHKICEFLAIEAQKTIHKIGLGDTKLLQFNASQARKYWHNKAAIKEQD